MERLFDDRNWQMAVESFVTSIFNRSGSTQSRDRYTNVLRTFFSDPLKSPQDYTRQDVESFLAHPSYGSYHPGLPVSVGTRNQRLAVLSSYYRYCSTYTITGDDGRPTALLQRLPPTTGMGYGKPAKVYRALNEHELELFFAQIPQHTVQGVRDRCIFTMLLYTAKRRTELTSLSWKDIEQTVIVDDDGSTHHGFVFRYYSKGHSREQRVQELPAECYSLLLRYLTISGRLETMQPDSPLFVSLPPPRGGNYRNTGVRLHGHSINKAVKFYAGKAGLHNLDNISCHSFRHSSARLRYSSGQDIRSIQNVLGHASLSATDTYLRALVGQNDNGLHLLRKRLGSILG